jgi:hypothetical protein
MQLLNPTDQVEIAAALAKALDAYIVDALAHGQIPFAQAPVFNLEHLPIYPVQALPGLPYPPDHFVQAVELVGVPFHEVP